MYKILTLYNADHNLWKPHGITTSTTSISGTNNSFVEFETDDIDVLKTEILKLDKEIGFKNIRIVKDITANYNVDIEIDDIISDEEINDKTVDDEDV